MILAQLALLLAPMQDAGALSTRAQSLAMEKRFDEAEALWRQAIAGAPDFFPALFNLGYMYYSTGRFDQAATWLAKAGRVSPRDFNTRYLLGATLVKLEKREEALKEWRAALGLQPGNLRLIQVMVAEYERGRYFQDAAALSRRALELTTDDPNLYFFAIKAHQDAGDYAAALEIAERAVRKFPASARANFEYGFHLQKAGRIEETLAALKKAMAADSTYEEPFFFYGDLLVRQGHDEEAIPYLRQAIQNRTDYVPARVTLSRALMNLKKWPEAIAELEETIRVDPHHPQPHLLLSQIYFRQGDEPRAKTEKDLSLRLRRENPNTLEAVQGRPFPDGP
jgi:tetratricopeptide (TPR) repeat protein